MALFGVLPVAAWGGSIGVIAPVGPLAIRTLGWATALADVSFETGSARVAMVAVEISGCLDRSLGAFTVRGCAGAAGGGWSARGSGFDVNRAPTVPWVAASAGLGLELPLGADVSLVGRGQGYFPFARPTLEVTDPGGSIERQTAPPAGFAASLGAMVGSREGEPEPDMKGVTPAGHGRCHLSWARGVRRRVRDSARVSRSGREDIVQETFLVAHRRGGFRQGEARPTTWLAEIALRLAMASRRARKRAPIADPDAIEAAPSSGSDPLSGAISAQTLTHVQRALDALDTERRALFVLFELEGESCDALAVAFGVPIGTIYSRLHAARAEFLAAYRRQSGEPAKGRTRGARA
jgi:RNA polymerase sigma-70 factor (ECF subfamily)